jgi:hypothetical protein
LDASGAAGVGLAFTPYVKCCLVQIPLGGFMARRHQTPQQPAYRDALFMESIAARPVRILTEYLDPLVRLRREEVGDTIVMFGSARIIGRDRALAHLRRLKALPGKKSSRRRIALRDARAAVAMSRYYEEARELAHRITAWSLTLGIPGASSSAPEAVQGSWKRPTAAPPRPAAKPLV